MTKPLTSFLGRLKRRPFEKKASVAQMQVLPLITLSDFEAMSEFVSHTVPVYINVAEHYKLLALLVKKASEVLCELNILIRFSMPGGTQIDPVLLTDNILILQDLKAEEIRLSKSSKKLLVIDDNFAHFEVDNGDNLISLRLYDKESSGENKLAPLIELLFSFGVSCE